MKQPINEIKRMQQLAGLIKENQEVNDDTFTPYQFDDERSKELYLKYAKAEGNPAWESGEFANSDTIDLQTLLNITGLTLGELKELSEYGDESWSLDIDEKDGTVTEFRD